MKKMLVFLLCLLVLCLMAVPGASAADISVRDEFAAHFAGFTGTFVMYDPAGDKYIVYNEPQSKKRLSPCSTFKIYNSLIGLETGVLDQEDVYTLFKWNGTQYSFPYWNRSYPGIGHPESVVWYFQGSPRASARNGCRKYIDKIGYGNKDISGGPDHLLARLFSADFRAGAGRPAQQAIFRATAVLSREYRDSAKEHHSTEDGGTKLMGKTGSALRNEKWVSGWFVGCVNKDGRYYVFATNIEAADGANGGKAREITKSILKEMGIL